MTAPTTPEATKVQVEWFDPELGRTFWSEAEIPRAAFLTLAPEDLWQRYLWPMVLVVRQEVQAAEAAHQDASR